MAFQSPDLVAAGLGVPDGTATEGPPLAEGLHLRWAFRRGLGFPWRGFHLFYRPHIRELNTLAPHLRKLGRGPGGLGTAQLLLPGFGLVGSDTELRLSQPPDSSNFGLDLSNRSTLWVRFPAGEPVHHVSAHLRFEASGQVEMTVHSHGVPVGRDAAAGQAGDLATVSLDYDAITSVEFTGGPAVLDDLHAAPVSWYAEAGWQPLPDLDHALCLPVAHPDYPIPEGAGNVEEAREVALSRVAPADGSAATAEQVDFEQLHEQLAILVDGGAGSEPMSGRFQRLVDELAPDARIPPAMLQHALDLVLLGSLEPVIAQMVGLYWVHRIERSETAHDYLVVADHANPEGFVRDAVLNQQAHPRDLPNTDSCITFGHRLVPPPELRPPERVRLYALPDAGARASGLRDNVEQGINRAGIRWELGESAPGAFWPERPAMFQLWRADLGTGQADAPSPETYEAVHDRPIVSARPVEGAGDTDRPEGWPDVRLQAIDSGLADGWYSYRVGGIDLFGRHSRLSEPGAWWQWAPPPSPRPWYYQGAGSDTVLHPHAVCLRDETPPPPPRAVEARALDPAEHAGWRADLDNAGAGPLIGARVRWSWPASHHRQAPDLAEFRIHYQTGMLNVLRGTVADVLPAGNGESRVVTDIDDDSGPDSYEGSSVRVGSRSFRVVGSDSTGTLELRVRDGHEGPPEAGKPCAVGLRSGHPRYTDYHRASSWQHHVHTIPFGAHDRIEPTSDGPVRHYEVTLPILDEDDPEGLPLEATLAEPIAYAHLGVSAVAEPPEPVELPDPGGGSPVLIDEFRTESAVSNPAPVYVVLREPPPAPAGPTVDGDELLATRADYHGRSYFTYRWEPAEHLQTHVYRALEETVIRTDRKARPRGHIDVDDLDDAALFPSEFEWDAQRIADVAAELNDLDDLAADGEDAALDGAYRALSNDALRIMAWLPGNERAFSQRTIDPLDPDDPAHADRRGPDDPDDYTPDVDVRCYVDEFDGRSSSRYLYRAAYVDPAHNRSDLGPASPPVATPKVTPPHAPAVAKVKIDDGQATISWTSNREPDLATYRVYRAETQENAADVRLMELVHEAQAPADPADRPARAAWTDEELVGGRRYWYRLTAADTVGNVSKPSKPVLVQAVDTRPPEPPSWEGATWLLRDGDGAVADWPDDGEVPDGHEPFLRLEWSSAAPASRFVLTRREQGTGAWRPVPSGGVPTQTDDGVYRFDDPGASHAQALEYRIWTVSPAGVEGTEAAVVAVDPPTQPSDAGGQ